MKKIRNDKSMFVAVGLMLLSTACGTPTVPSPGTREPSPSRGLAIRSSASEPVDDHAAQEARSRTESENVVLAARNDAVLARVLPTTLTLIQGSGQARAWFDNDPATTVGTVGEAVEISARHTSAGLDGVRVRGPARGRLIVSFPQNGPPGPNEPTPSVAPITAEIRLNDDRWQSVHFSETMRARNLTLRWEPAAGSTTLSDVELWGRMQEASLLPQPWLADRLLTAHEETSQFDALPSSHRVSAVELAGEPRTGEFSIAVPADLRTEGQCGRAFLRYNLQGVSHWTHVAKTVNDVALAPPQTAVAAVSGGVQLEEIPARLLHSGGNTIRFAPSDQLGPSGYRVQNVSLLCVPNNAVISADQSAHSHPLTDDDRTTTAQVAAPRTGTAGARGAATAATPPSPVGPLHWAFSSLTQAHAISFFLGDSAGGVLVVKPEGSTVRHRIPLAGREPGWNSVFLPDDFPAADSYWIESHLDRESSGHLSEVRLSGTPTSPPHQLGLVVTYPHHGECVDQRLHVQGFLRGVSTPEEWRVRVLAQDTQALAAGVFSIDGTIGTSDATEIEIVATRQARNNEPPLSLRTTIPLQRCVSTPTATVTTARDDLGAPYGVWVHPDRASVLDVGEFRVEIPRGAVARATRVTARPLSASEVAEVDAAQGMTNVTRGARAYRLGPHPMQFLVPLKITIPVQASALPVGKSTQDVGVYFFDENARQWNEVARDVSVRAESVTAMTNHFTDFMAATGSAPEGGEGGAGNHNSMGGGGGDPLAGVGLIPAPQGGPSGDASTGFSLAMPPGRRGMQPQLAVNYSSTGGEGFLGMGWSLPLSGISIDTRFGVPDYRSEPTYLLDGQQLVLVQQVSPGVDRFEPRVAGSNLRILRIRDALGFHWEVTDPSGTTSNYGTSENSQLCAAPGASAPPVVGDIGLPPRRCATWAIASVVDPYRNAVTYSYEQVTGVLPSQAGVAEPWVQMYPKRISYTSHLDLNGASDLAPYYHVVFTRRAGRPDVQLGARSGFIVRTDSVLEDVSVMAGGSVVDDALVGAQLVRSYGFHYRLGDFEKTLLHYVTVHGKFGAELYRHTFDYFEAERNSSGELGFARATRWSDSPPLSMDFGHGETGGIGATIGIGDPAFRVRGAVSLGYQRHGGHTSDMNVDVNGDGLPDYLSDDGRLILNQFATETDRTRGSLRATSVHQLGTSLQDEGSHQFALEGAVHYSGSASFNGGGGATWVRTWTVADRIVTDVDGDGRVDLINGPVSLDGADVLPVRENPFALGTNAFGVADVGSSRANYTLGGLVAHEIPRLVQPAAQPEAQRQLYRTEPLVGWHVPFCGRVKISGAASVANPASDGVEAVIVRVSNREQSPVWRMLIRPSDGPCIPSVDGAGRPACNQQPLRLQLVNGDDLYFRVRAGTADNATVDGDETAWNPHIEYEQYCDHCVPPPTNDGQCENPPQQLVSYDRTADFRLADRDHLAMYAPFRGQLRVRGLVKASEAASFRIYRRRVTPRVGFALPVPTPGEPLTEEQFTSYASVPTDTVVAVFPAAGAIALQPNVGVEVDEAVDVEPGDQILTHVLLSPGQDPAAVTDFGIGIKYLRICNGLNGAQCHDVGECRSPAIPNPGANPQAIRSCPLLGATAPELTEVPEVLAVVDRAMPAISDVEPSGVVGAIARMNLMFGWYRGWSVGQWNGTFEELNTARLSDPIGLDAEAVAARVRAQLPLPAPAFMPMIPRPNGDTFKLGTTVLAQFSNIPLWRGSGLDSFITPTSLKPSATAPFLIGADGSFVPVMAGARELANAPRMRLSVGDTFGVSVSTGAAGLSPSLGHTGGPAYSYEDFLDINGDGRADSIRWNGSEGTVQYQLPRLPNQTVGRFSAPISISLPPNRGALRVVEAAMTTGGFGAASQHSGWVIKPDSHATMSTTLPFGASAGLGAGLTHAKVELIDLNGDGLQDSVRAIANADADQNLRPYLYEVAYNLGYAFTRPVIVTLGASDANFTELGNPLDALVVQQNCNVSAQVGVAGGGGGGNIGISRTRVAMIDLNGDGLPDRVTRNRQVRNQLGQPVWTVQFNLGDRFAPGEHWTLPEWTQPADVSPPIGCIGDLASLGDDDRDMPSAFKTFSFVANLPIPVRISLGFIGLSFDFAAMFNYDWHHSNAGLSDIDGDGHVDHVLRTDSGVYARMNGYSQVNLLRAIHSPTGATTTLTYAREGNHVGRRTDGNLYEMPSNRSVLSQVEVADPLTQTFITKYDYFASGNFDRAEREFYGFAHVRATRPDGQHTDSYFHNQDYYRRFTAYETRTFDANDRILSRQVSEWAAPPLTLPLRTGRFFPAKTRFTTYFYDGVVDVDHPKGQTAVEFAYNERAQLTHRTDRRGGDPTRDLRTAIEYYADIPNWIFKPQHVQVIWADAINQAAPQALQESTATLFNAQGDPTRVERRLTGGIDPLSGLPWDGTPGRNPFVTYTYDTYGNVQVERDSTGAFSARTFHALTQTHPIATRDQFGLESQTEWDLVLSVPTTTRDASGSRSRAEFDQFGRLQAVYGPQQFGGGLPTVSFDYELGSPGASAPLWGRSRQTDFVHPGEAIDSVTLVDGLGRVLQHKREIEIEDAPEQLAFGWSVSAPIVYDSVGRVHRVHQPQFDRLTPFDQFAVIPAINPTRIEYDSFDRVRFTLEANGIDSVTHEYDFAAHQDGEIGPRHVVTFRRANDAAATRSVQSFTDIEGNLRMVRQTNVIAGELATLDTLHTYDILNRRISVIDAARIETRASYDSLGRMIELIDPDSGSTRYQYSLGGDLAARITANMRGNQRINYVYDRHRLTAINYPNAATGNVRYTYGQQGAGFFSAGRITAVDDASGRQEFRYGVAGELVWNRRTLNPIRQGNRTLFAGFTATTQFSYDGHGRMLSMTYPDGEQLQYNYNLAGMVTGVTGTRNGVAHEYVNYITYDVYGRQHRVRYGNGSQTVYDFDPVEQRLREQRTTALDGDIQRLQFQYNAQGLISDVVNNVSPGTNRGRTVQHFAYDHLQNLVQAFGTFDRAPGQQQRYLLNATYDGIGRMQRMTQTDESIGGDVITRNPTTTHNFGYTYEAGRRGRASTVGPLEYRFDDNGNVISRRDSDTNVRRQMDWDDEDRLVQVQERNVRTNFIYDAGGTRTHKQSDTGVTAYPNAFITVKGGSEVTKHVFINGQRVSAVVNQVSSAQPAVPVYGAPANDKLYWIHANHVGGAHYVTNAAGAVHEHLEHLPFGESWIEQRSGQDPAIAQYQFSGVERDKETQLIYVGARYYDPREARWMSRDPALEGNMAGGGVADPRNLLSYGYAFNSPISYSDPDGRQAAPHPGAPSQIDAGVSDATTVPTGPGRETITFSEGSTVRPDNEGTLGNADTSTTISLGAQHRQQYSVAGRMVAPNGNYARASDRHSAIQIEVSGPNAAARMRFAQFVHTTLTASVRNPNTRSTRYVTVSVELPRCSTCVGPTQTGTMAHPRWHRDPQNSPSPYYPNNDGGRSRNFATMADSPSRNLLAVNSALRAVQDQLQPGETIRDIGWVMHAATYVISAGRPVASLRWASTMKLPVSYSLDEPSATNINGYPVLTQGELPEAVSPEAQSLAVGDINLHSGDITVGVPIAVTQFAPEHAALIPRRLP